MKEVKNPRRPMILYYLIILVIIVLFNWLLMPSLQQSQVKKVNYSTFMKYTEQKKIATVQVRENDILFTLKSSASDGSENTVTYKTGRMPDENLTERLYKSGAQFTSNLQQNSTTSSILSSILGFVVPLILFIWIGNWLSKKMVEKAGGANSMMFGMGKSNAKLYVQSTEGIHFSDVAGEDEAKENLEEIVEYLHDPKKYTAIGATMPKGVLLVGPPGTGKTMLAKAVAGEANVPFFSISGSEFVEMFVGMGASKVRDLFKQAKEKAPCIVFIDEIDAIGKKRDNQLSTNDEREQTLNQLLTEMDGFDNNNGVMILAATNRPEILDPALLRPGRFDRRVPVELPDLKGREEILKVHARKVNMGRDVNFNTIARMASGASGAELANIVNEAALRAVRMGRKVVHEEDMEESIEVVIAGYQRKNAILSAEEKKIVAYHEIGHAMVAALQNHSEPVQKITIVPRTSGALGYTMQVDEGQKNLLSKEELLNRIATLTGGRAAEETVFGSITTGASNDIEQATKLARAMITRYGMSDEFDMVAMEHQTNQYLGGDSELTCSPETQKDIDKKVVELVRQQHEKAIKLLKDNRSKLDELAQYLYEKETITGEQFMEILHQPPKYRLDTNGAQLDEPESQAAPQNKDTQEPQDAAQNQTAPQSRDAQSPQDGVQNPVNQ
jgi:cell division protease FtsH